MWQTCVHKALCQVEAATWMLMQHAARFCRPLQSVRAKVAPQSCSSVNVSIWRCVMESLRKFRTTAFEACGLGQENMSWDGSCTVEAGRSPDSLE